MEAAMASSDMQPVPRQGGVRVDVRTRGEVDPGFVDLARHVIIAVVTAHNSAAGPVRLRVSTVGCAKGQTLIQVNLQVRGMPARVQICARTPQAAARAALDRLERQIHRVAANMDAIAWPLPFRRRLAVPGEGAVAR